MNECKPLVVGVAAANRHSVALTSAGEVFTFGQGLTLAYFTAQLEDLLEHIAHVRAQLEYLRDTSMG